jgi:hypothetical protein
MLRCAHEGWATLRTRAKTAPTGAAPGAGMGVGRRGRGPRAPWLGATREVRVPGPLRGEAIRSHARRGWGRGRSRQGAPSGRAAAHRATCARGRARPGAPHGGGREEGERGERRGETHHGLDGRQQPLTGIYPRTGREEEEGEGVYSTREREWGVGVHMGEGNGA